MVSCANMSIIQIVATINLSRGSCDEYDKQMTK